MIKYLSFIIWLTAIIIIYGSICPTLISDNSYESVIIGITIFVLGLPIFIFTFKKIIFTKGKKDEKN